MRCPHCQFDLARLTADGTPHVRTRGLLLRKAGVVLICPECKGDVEPTADLMRAFGNYSVLFFRGGVTKT